MDRCCRSPRRARRCRRWLVCFSKYAEADVEIPEIVPQHFPGANLIHRQNLEAEQTRITILRHDGVPGRPISLEIGSDTARVMMLVDGKRTVDQIAALFNQDATPLPKDEMLRAFSQYSEQGLLSWRGR